MTQSQHDVRLEAAIETRRQELIAAQTREERRRAWEAMRSLIESRTAAQVWRMERARGLR